MSLYSAFYSGLSGLSTNANALNVIGNNLSNINTVGFKGSDMTFRDIFSATGSTQGNGNPIQFGLGVQMNSVNQNFSQSSFQSTGNALDMGIQGNGFFTLKATNGTQVFSRAGNFTRDRDGFLVASDGSNVMGWNRTTVNGVGGVYTTGAVAPIQISAATAGAQATANISLTANLNASAPNITVANPISFSSPVQVYDSLGQVQNLMINYMKVRDGQAATSSISPATFPVTFNLNRSSPNATTFNTAVSVFDSLGISHPLTVTYTKLQGDPASLPLVPDKWSYSIADGSVGAVNPVGDGTIDFSTGAPVALVNKALAVTTSTAISNPMTFSVTGMTNASSASTPALRQMGGVTTGNLTWNYTVGDAALNPDGSPRAAAFPNGSMQFDAKGNLVALDGTNPPTTAANPTITVPWLNGTSNNITFNVIGTTGASNFTGLSSPNSTISSTQDGYPAGTLQSMTVDQDGIISGTFTNGQILSLAQLALSSFTNTNGLQQAGNNHWSQTLASGAPTLGIANQGGRGSILGSNLELSNIDVASEFTKLITSQRGYEANSKIVTTTDQLMQVTLNLKQ